MSQKDSYKNTVFQYAKRSGPKETRTPDLRIANATLYQLSYGPASEDHKAKAPWPN